MEVKGRGSYRDIVAAGPVHDVKVSVHGDRGLDAEVARSPQGSLLGSELLRDPDVLGIRLRSATTEATADGLGLARRGSNGTLGSGQGEGKGSETHDERSGDCRW